MESDASYPANDARLFPHIIYGQTSIFNMLVLK